MYKHTIENFIENIFDEDIYENPEAYGLEVSHTIHHDDVDEIGEDLMKQIKELDVIGWVNIVETYMDRFKKEIIEGRIR
jgi:hypothetical protein